MKELKCDMERGCVSNVTHIDRKGYVYCTVHGLQRRQTQPCRKLRAEEFASLLEGKPLKSY